MYLVLKVLADDRPRSSLRVSSWDNHYGSQCSFSCAIGYCLEGSSTARRVSPSNLYHAVWNNTIPICKPANRTLIALISH